MIIPAETHWSPWQCIRCNEDDSQRNVLTTRGSKMISGTKWPSLAPWLPTSCWEEGLDTFRSEQPTPCYLGIIYLPHEHFHRPKDWHWWLLYIYIIYYQRWPLYLGLSVFWFLDPGTTCRIPGTICRVPGTIWKKHALYWGEWREIWWWVSTG